MTDACTCSTARIAEADTAARRAIADALNLQIRVRLLEREVTERLRENADLRAQLALAVSERDGWHRRAMVAEARTLVGKALAWWRARRRPERVVVAVVGGLRGGGGPRVA